MTSGGVIPTEEGETGHEVPAAVYRARKERIAEHARLMQEGDIDAVVKALECGDYESACRGW
jgi:hypothetical protein